MHGIPGQILYYVMYYVSQIRSNLRTYQMYAIHSLGKQLSY